MRLVTGDRATVFACARCGGMLARQMPASIRVICRHCGATAVLDDASVTRSLDVIAKGTLPPVRRFTLDAFYRHRGVRWQVIGVQRFEGTVRRLDHDRGRTRTIDAEYTLWWLLNERRELAYLGDHGGTRFWSEPRVPEGANVPEGDSRDHEHGEWTLVDAVGEFPYRVTPGERHHSVEHAWRREGLSVDTWLDERGEPRKIEFARTRVLTDEEVLEGLDDTEGLAMIGRWTHGRTVGIASTLLALGALLASSVAASSLEVVADRRWLALLIALLSVVAANVCGARAQVIADRRATLALTVAPESDVATSEAA